MKKTRAKAPSVGRVQPPRGRARLPAPAAPHAHGPRIALARADVLHGDTLVGVTELFRALGDPTRVRILSVLAAGEACVFDLAESLGMTSSAISHQLRVLRALRLVRNRRDGREIYYALDDEHVVVVIESARDHLRHDGRALAAHRRGQ